MLRSHHRGSDKPSGLVIQRLNLSRSCLVCRADTCRAVCRVTIRMEAPPWRTAYPFGSARTGLAHGCRDANEVGGAGTAANGVQSALAYRSRAVLAPGSIAATLTTWTASTRTTNVLVVLDISGSMKDIVTGTKTRMDLAPLLPPSRMTPARSRSVHRMASTSAGCSSPASSARRPAGPESGQTHELDMRSGTAGVE